MLSKWNWKYLAIFLFGALVTTLDGVILGSVFKVAGLRAAGEDCEVKVEVDDPMGMVPCEKSIDALRWDSLWGVLLVLGILVIMALFAAAAVKFESVKFWKAIPLTVLITLAVTFAIIPWILDRADDADLIREVTIRSVIATVIFIIGSLVAGFWQPLMRPIRRAMRGVRSSR